MSSTLIQCVDALHEGKEFSKIFSLLEDYIQTNYEESNSNVEILWRFARAHYDLSSGLNFDLAIPSPFSFFFKRGWNFPKKTREFITQRTTDFYSLFATRSK